MTRFLRQAAALLLCVLCLALYSPGASANPNQFAINVDASGNALGGYDAVAYFTDAKAMKGNSTFQHEWQGAKWLFASAEHRDLFAEAPEKYAPRIGGFCAVGAMKGRMVDVDPRMWLIVRDRLYLYVDASVRESALLDAEAQAAEAEARWQEIRQGQ